MNHTRILPTAAIVAAIFVSGCASHYTRLYKPGTEQSSYCSHTGYGLISSMIAGSRHEECVSQMKSKGYTQDREAKCTTDTECAKLCPKDDKTCDGGPQ